jgi:hypothetical protein
MKFYGTLRRFMYYSLNEEKEPTLKQVYDLKDKQQEKLKPKSETPIQNQSPSRSF